MGLRRLLVSHWLPEALPLGVLPAFPLGTRELACFLLTPSPTQSCWQETHLVESRGEEIRARFSSRLATPHLWANG